jgi:hypothetical protein
MENISPEIIIALIGMISAIWAPSVTAFVQRNKELRLEKLRIYQKAKLDAYNNFSNAYSKVYHLISLDVDDCVQELIKASHAVMIYCNKSTCQKLILLVQMTSSIPFRDDEAKETFKNLLYETMTLLNKEVNKDKK